MCRGRELRIAMIGTRGVPARYGGFETAVEEIGARLAASGHQVTVYCRNPNQRITQHRGMSLVNLPAIRRQGIETLSHAALSMVHSSLRRTDAAVVFNAGNAPLLPLLKARRIPVAMNVDGIEWRREKWGPVATRYYRTSERIAVRLANTLIADARGIQDYYREEHGAESTYIPYGAPVLSQLPDDALRTMGLVPRQYHLVVARFEPENNLPVILAGYRASKARYPLVVVGHAQFPTPEVRAAFDEAAADPRVELAGAIWDQNVLNQLYAHALSYVHGHSVGGTNPSLLRAMGAGAPVVAFDVSFNREVLGPAGIYFSAADQLAAHLDDAEQEGPTWHERGRSGQQRVIRLFDWDAVAEAYEDLCYRLVDGQPGGRYLPGSATGPIGSSARASDSEGGTPTHRANRHGYRLSLLRAFNTRLSRV